MVQSGHGEIDGVVRAIEQNNDVDLISKPELLVINGQTAEIKAGGDLKLEGGLSGKVAASGAGKFEGSSAKVN